MSLDDKERFTYTAHGIVNNAVSIKCAGDLASVVDYARTESKKHGVNIKIAVCDRALQTVAEVGFYDAEGEYNSAITGG